MRIAFICPFVPSPIKVRPYHLIKQLGARHAVTVIAPIFHDGDVADLAALRSICDETIGVPVSRARRLSNYLRAVPSGDPVQTFDIDSPAFRDTVRQIGKLGFDVAHVELLRASRLARHLPANLPVVLDAVDSYGLLWRQTVQHGPNWRIRLIARVELERTCRLERVLGDRFARVLVVSERDRAGLDPNRRQPRVRVVPNGVDLDYFAPAATAPDPETVVITGTMHYHPNVSGVLAFARSVMPIIWQRRPATKLVLAGADPPKAIRALAADPRISVTGRVADLRPYLATASVAVSPTIYGTGVQNKVLEAMAMATPVVVSRNTAAGFETLDPPAYLVADSAGEMAAQVLMLLESDETRRWHGLAGRRYVERHHDWARVADQLIAEYEGVQEEARRSSGGRTLAAPLAERPTANELVALG